MFQSYICTDKFCHDHYLHYLGDLGKVIDHLRGIHGQNFTRRPSALGMLDTHGNMWYCFRCSGKLGKDHKSFKSDRAMWDHLNACHDLSLDDITRDL